MVFKLINLIIIKSQKSYLKFKFSNILKHSANSKVLEYLVKSHERFGNLLSLVLSLRENSKKVVV